MIRMLQRRPRDVDADAEGTKAARVRWRHLDQRDVQIDFSPAEQQRNILEKADDSVALTASDSRANIFGDDKRLRLDHACKYLAHIEVTLKVLKNFHFWLFAENLQALNFSKNTY
jgi:hypothetical protein